MKKFLFFLLTTALFATASPARNLPKDALGTVSYDVNYNLGIINTKVATVTISLQPSTWNDIQAYYSKATVKTTPIFSLFVGSDYLAEVYLSRNDLSPLYFINPFQRKGQSGKFEYTYDSDRKVIASVTVTDVNQPAVEEDFPLDGHTMELLSLLHYVRFLDVSHNSKPISLNVLMGGKSFPAQLSYKGIDEDHFPGQQAEHFLLEMTEHGLMENGSGNELQIWRSTGKDARLLGLEAPLSAGFMSVKISQ